MRIKFDGPVPPKPVEPKKKEYEFSPNYAVIHGDGSGVLAAFQYKTTAIGYAKSDPFGSSLFVVDIATGKKID